MPGGSSSRKGWLCMAFSQLFSLLFPSLLSSRKGQEVMLPEEDDSARGSDTAWWGGCVLLGDDATRVTYAW